MTITRTILAKIGREVLNKHPDIAGAILNKMPSPGADLDKIEYYFQNYVEISNCQTGPVYKSELTEVKKVFISAMACLYYGQRLFTKTLSTILKQQPSAISRTLEEVRFRYLHDHDFKTRVDDTLQKITNDQRPVKGIA